jgi:flagellar basal-body rod modification protein FlgD
MTSITAANQAAAGAVRAGQTAPGTPVAATAAGNAASKLAGDMTNFLKLLTTQLKNQDPTQPLDANQFTAQLAQFAAVEQQISVNKHMEGLLALQRASSMLAAAPLVGQQVEVNSDRVGLAGGLAQELRLPSTAAAGGATRARIVVQDAAGGTLREAVVPLARDGSGWAWDGLDSRGRRMPDGVYRVAATGVNGAGDATGALATTVAGTVTAVTREGEDPKLALGRLTVGLEALRGVR